MFLKPCRLMAQIFVVWLQGLWVLKVAINLAMIVCRYDGMKNRKKNHMRDDKSCEGIATKMVGKTLEKPIVLLLTVFKIIKHL